jgi:hypothetical protein
VPVFVLNSQNNEPIPGDEDPIPEDGNQHPFLGPRPENQHNDYWENVQDLNDIEQANVDEGWEPPLLPNAAAAATGANLGNDWHVWPQEGEVVDQNELQQVQALADELVQQAMLQLPNAGQTSEFVSSEALGFYRAQGTPIRLELPLVQNHHEIVPYLNNMDRDSDYPIFQLARTLQLHQVFGLMPLAQMLLQDILQASMMNHHDLYFQRPLNLGLSQFPVLQQNIQTLHLIGKLPVHINL